MKLYHFSLIFIIIAGCFLVIINIKTRTFEYASREKEYLEEGLKRALDEATYYMLEEEMSGLEINKSRGADMILEGLYLGLDIKNPEQKEQLKMHIPIISVTSNDGFYVYFTSEYQGANKKTYYKKQWSEKHPFYYEDQDFIYRFTLTDLITIYDKNGILGLANSQKFVLINVNDFIYLDKFEMFRRKRPNSFLLSPQEFKQVKADVITSTMEQVLSTYCNRYNEIAKKMGISYDFHFPLYTSELSKAIETPSLFVLIQGYPLSFSKDVVFNRFLVGSSQIVKRQLYIIEETHPHPIYHKKECQTLLLTSGNKGKKACYSVREAVGEGAYPCQVCIETAAYN